MTWNPVTGCSKVSAGCKHCYAETMARRLQRMGIAKYSNGFDVTLHSDALRIPYTWRKPRTVFVNSMSDLFHEDVPLGFIQQVFAVMRDCSLHRFQILTKRSTRLLALDDALEWAPNIWMGVSVESADHLERIDHLRGTNAELKFLSLEPLLGPLPNIDLTSIGWVIVGGESGPKSRPMDRHWVLDVKRACRRYGVPFFFKQWGGTNKKLAGRELQGRTFSEMPGSIAATA